MKEFKPIPVQKFQLIIILLIIINFRAERDAEYQALSKSLGMKSFPEAQFYMKQVCIRILLKAS